jgi:hypothetical protein
MKESASASRLNSWRNYAGLDVRDRRQTFGEADYDDPGPRHHQTHKLQTRLRMARELGKLTCKSHICNIFRGEKRRLVKGT